MKRHRPLPSTTTQTAEGNRERKIPLPEPARLRAIPRAFSWIDHRLVRHGHLRHCGDTEALALYLFLVTVGDHRGLSYYSENRIGEHLPLSAVEVRSARKRLIECGLIAYRKPFYQVLALEGIGEVDAAARVREARPEAYRFSVPDNPSSRQSSAEDDDGRLEDPATMREALRESLALLRGNGEAKS